MTPDSVDSRSHRATRTRAPLDPASGDPAPAIDARWYRQVLAQYPTGVCVVTADPADLGPSGMVVGSFTSVSIDPPLIAFFPDKTSTSWPKIERAGSFCVNILGAEQEQVCRQFASKTGDKFAGQAHRPGVTGAPILEDSVAWIECDIDRVIEAGDHYIVLGLVRDLQLEKPRLPLVFFQGGYGRFSPLSLVAPDTAGALTEQLRDIDRLRPAMEHLARDLRCQCVATARIGDEVAVLANARDPRGDDGHPTLVGQRVPYLPPMSSIFAAWSEPTDIEAWLQRAPTPGHAERDREAVQRVRERGYSIGLLSDAQRAFASALDRMASEPELEPQIDLFGLVGDLTYDPVEIDAATLRSVRQISVPVFGRTGSVDIALTIYGFNRPRGGVPRLIERLRATAQDATALLGGAPT